MTFLIFRLSIENFDICEKHLTKAIETADSETIIAKLVARCGKDSPVPLIMGLDSIFAGIDTTGMGRHLKMKREICSIF